MADRRRMVMVLLLAFMALPLSSSALATASPPSVQAVSVNGDVFGGGATTGGSITVNATDTAVVAFVQKTSASALPATTQMLWVNLSSVPPEQPLSRLYSYNGTSSAVEVWYRSAPTAGTFSTWVTWCVDGGGCAPSLHVTIAFIVLSGTPVPVEFGPHASTTGTGTAAAVTLHSEVGSLVLDGLTEQPQRNSTPGTGQTRLWSTPAEEYYDSAGASIPGASTVVPAWTVNGTSVGWSLTAVDVQGIDRGLAGILEGLVLTLILLLGLIVIILMLASTVLYVSQARRYRPGGYGPGSVRPDFFSNWRGWRGRDR